jgi:hypothetical protein
MNLEKMKINKSYKRILLGMIVPYLLLFIGFILQSYITEILGNSPESNGEISIISFFELLIMIILGFLAYSPLLLIYSYLMDKVLLKRFAHSVYLSMFGSLMIVLTALGIYFMAMFLLEEQDNSFVLESLIIGLYLGLSSGAILYIFYPNKEH